MRNWDDLVYSLDSGVLVLIGRLGTGSTCQELSLRTPLTGNLESNEPMDSF